jgi:hypothetical protein
MDFLEELLDKLRSWMRKLVEALIGQNEESEPELIPIPVKER